MSQTQTETTSGGENNPISQIYTEAKRRIPPFDRATNAVSNRVETLKSNSQCMIDKANEIWKMDEVKTVRSRFWDFLGSLIQVMIMIGHKVLDRYEDWIGVEKEDDGEVKEKGFMWRFGTVLGKSWGKIEDREQKVQGTWEEKIYIGLRYFIATVLAVVSMFIEGVRKYKGPGKEVVGPFAEKVQKIMPNQNGDFNVGDSVGVIPGSPELSDNDYSTPRQGQQGDHDKME